jgi:peptide deformylase
MSKVEGEIEVDEDELDAESEARRRLALAQIRQYPDVALKMTARQVAHFDDPLRDLVERMKLLMRDAHGIGLAATQVGVLQRVFVFTPKKDVVAAVVNPEIVERSTDTDVAEEGCLSIQGVLVPIERPVRITLAGKDEHGQDVSFELDDIFARAAQHEVDHLDGVLIIDRTTPEARREALAILRPRIVIA